jgi:hypothetical protein
MKAAPGLASNDEDVVQTGPRWHGIITLSISMPLALPSASLHLKLSSLCWEQMGSDSAAPGAISTTENDNHKHKP